MKVLTCLTVLATADGQEPANLRDLNEPLVDHSEGQLFLNEAFRIIMEEVLCKGTDVEQKVKIAMVSDCSEYSEQNLLIPVFLLQVCEWREPEELARILDLELRATGEPQHSLLQRVKDVAKYSIKTSKTVRDR